jgi:hypothetical protein
VSRGRKTAIWIVTAAFLGVVIAVVIVKWRRFGRIESLTGTVLVQDMDARKQLPVANVSISADAGGRIAQAKSDASGFFRLNWRAWVWRGEQATLEFRHPGYQPVDATQALTDQLYIARMTPVPATDMKPPGPEVTVAETRVRYSVTATTTINFGSTARTFEVVNTGNVPCVARTPCSPDGKWKAAIASLSLDAGEGQEFQNARVSCIAGPCPFTRIESDGFSRGGRTIRASARVWSDTATFLAEAEVVHTTLTDAIRQAFPSIFGRAMTFTLPPTGQGPSIEAEVGGNRIVFPLGPDLNLSWATCTLQIEPNRAKLYSCELKPGYRFR